jgi:hypothetical protein
MSFGSVDFATLVVSPPMVGKDVLLATHGFNVDRQAGIDSLSLWKLPRSTTLLLLLGLHHPGIPDL